MTAGQFDTSRPVVVLVRHGETGWAATGRHTSRSDVPLTARGRRQAELVGEWLAVRRFALVLSSPSGRAWETCQLAGYGATAEKTDDLLEWDYGAYEGRRTPEIRTERPGWLLWTDGAPAGETAADVGRRTDRIIARLLAADGDAVLFGHGHALRVLAARWLGLAPEWGRALLLTPGALCMLGWEREVPVVIRWNDAPAPP